MAHLIQPRRVDGRFQEISGKTPPPLLELPERIAALYPRNGAAATTATLLDELLPIDDSASPTADGAHDAIELTADEAEKFAAAVASAMRDARTPASLAALAAERRVVESRFGAINWAA
jgi:hypothetical protein